MAIVTAHKLDLKQYDAVAAFINAFLDKPLLCECSDRYKYKEQMSQILRAICGLKY